MDKKCPHCGSTEILKQKLSAGAIVIGILLIGFPFPFLGRKYHCFDCYKDFKLK